jgi:hypothetical protein
MRIGRRIPLIVSKIQGRTFVIAVAAGTQRLRCDAHWIEAHGVGAIAEDRLLFRRMHLVFLLDLLQLIVQRLERIWTLKEI